MKPVIKINADSFARLKAMNDGVFGFTLPLTASRINKQGFVQERDTRLG